MTRKYNILVVGSGSIGERHVRCMINTERANVGICELNSDLRQQVIKRYNLEYSFDSLEDALKENWDAAVIATPAHTHIALSMQCAKAGLALLVEKPLAVDPQTVAPLLEEVKKHNVKAAVAYVYRAHPALREMREQIISGKFGKPLELVAVGGQNFPTYRPAYASTYYARHETGGGAVQDALTHKLNASEWLVGPITKVNADMAHLVLDGVQVEDTVHVIARHGDVLASYALNQHQAPNENSITVVCERGTLRFNLHQNSWQAMGEPGTDWQIHKTDFKQRDDWFTAQENAFLDCLDGKSKPLCTLEEGLQTLRVNKAILESAKQDGEKYEIIT